MKDQRVLVCSFNIVFCVSFFIFCFVFLTVSYVIVDLFQKMVIGHIKYAWLHLTRSISGIGISINHLKQFIWDTW